MRWMSALVVLVACGDPKAQPDAAVMIDTLMADAAIDADPNKPMTLVDTGLCVDAGCTQIASGIHAYTPRWELYSDGATKRRWIYLPPGAKITTTDPDHWELPVGTKLWKEFTRGSVRVETRLVMRVGPGNTNADWFYGAFVWNATQDATTLEQFGLPDANGTEHDVPNRQQCRECHDAVPNRVLGFGVLQLDYDNPTAGEIDMPALIAGAPDLLDVKPTGSVPLHPLPGNTTVEQPALGYMHANCGGCHNPASKVYMDITPLSLRLAVGSLTSLAATPAYVTAVNQDGMLVDGATKIVLPGQPDQSILIKRFETTNTAQLMPKLGVEIPDPAGKTLLRTWITDLQ